MWIKRTIAVLGSCGLGLAAIVVGASPANASDRPNDVAFVQAWPHQVLQRNGTVTAMAGVRCAPGWAPAELDVLIGQGTSSADGFTVPTVKCDNRWHGVIFRIRDVSGPLHPGAVLVSSQFLVTNIATGDSAGAHDVQRPACIRHPGGSC